MKTFGKIIIFICIIFVLNAYKLSAQEKIKIGLLVPLTGKDAEIGQSIIKATRLAINKINDDKIEILPKDTESNALKTFSAAKELREVGAKIVIGPIFNKNLNYLDKFEDMIFLSLTNKNINNPKNIISAGINATSQLNSIVKFQKLNDIKRTILLTPNEDYKEEILNSVLESKIKLKWKYFYDTDPTLLTKKIEEITRYPQRKQNLKDEIKRLENSNETNKEKKIENLKKKHALGGINFDSVIIADFDQNLKSVTTSLLYTDVSPERIYYMTFNQWFDESLLKETSIQPIYFPSINKENFDSFSQNYKKIYDEFPNELSFLSYDLIGLVYYIIFQNNFIVNEKIFYKKNKFKGKIGIFEISKNKITHQLNFYSVENGGFKKIF